MARTGRVIGRVDGSRPGPLVIATAAIHGNEPAGVRALGEVFHWIENVTAADFRGTFVGLTGNLQAFGLGLRFLDRDFNRMWTRADVDRVLLQADDGNRDEDRELFELYTYISGIIREIRPSSVYFLDLHTTSAGGGIFCIPTDESRSLELGKTLRAPVILGIFDKVQGTLLRFAADGHFTRETDTPVYGAAFEAGQHDDEFSVSRSVSAIIHTLQHAGCTTDTRMWNSQEDVPGDSLSGLPRVVRLLYVHHIQPDDQFVMRPGYVNFQRVKAGEHLADDIRGQVLSPNSGMILMPLYQSQGSDGFFLVGEEGRTDQ
ncbi:MAG: succinylglutamate desuccinylase/aspartoacylase family protein [Bacteroidota bacterium]